MSRDADIDRAAEFHDAIHAHWEREGMSRTTRRERDMSERRIWPNHTHSVIQHAHGGYDEHEHRIEDTVARLHAVRGDIAALGDSHHWDQADYKISRWAVLHLIDRAIVGDSPEKTT